MNVIKNLQKEIETLKCNTEEEYIKELQYIFYKTAKDLMNNYVLKIGEFIEIELKELEFYFQDKEKHNDEFTHGHDLQKQCCKFYMHGSGIDITFGNEIYFGGILIRGIKIIDKKKQTEQYIAGPNKVKDNIIKNIELGLDIEINNYQNLQEKIAKVNKNKIILEEKENTNKEENKYLYIYSREGLLKKFQKFSHALYRFFSYDYFKEKNNIINRDSIKPKEEIRAVSFIIHNEVIDRDYSIDNIKNKIENYCKEQNCKYHICYYMELFKNKLQNTNKEV